MFFANSNYNLIIYSIGISEIFVYESNGLPQTHKAAFCGGSEFTSSKFTFGQIEYF